MKYVLYLLLCLFIASCNPKEADEPADISMLQPTIAPTKESIAIKKAIAEIETKDLEMAGEKISSIQIDGMEAIKISMKDFLMEEKNSQQVDFNNYMKYLDRFTNTKSALNNPLARTESQAKHNAVIKYLDQLIPKAAVTKTMYKVVYHLNATTGSNTYNQPKTTYLDENYKKMKVNYLHLKS